MIERLREKDYVDVAEMLETNSLNTAIGVIKRRFKTLREKKKREEASRKVGAEKQATVLEGELLI